jgi:hypothetical protein
VLLGCDRMKHEETQFHERQLSEHLPCPIPLPNLYVL